MRIAIVLGACLLSAGANADPALPAAHNSTPPTAAPADPATPAADSSTPPAADSSTPAPAALAPARPLVGFAVRGDSKVRPRTLGYLAHVVLGDRIGGGDLARIEQALISSELFKSVQVALEDAPRSAAAGEPTDGVILVATAVDKQSWIVAPTVFALPGNQAFGVGFAENNFRGLDQKFLLYAQIGTQTSLLFATFLDPSFRGSKLTWRTDLYLFRRQISEYVNPHGDPQSTEVGRSTTATYLGGGALIGWNFLWWLVGDLRLRGAYVYFRNAKDGDDAPVAPPAKDGWDFTLQAHLTLDRRHNRFGVTWGSYAQLTLEPSLPGLDSYGYQIATLRAYQSWRLLEEHELELRTGFAVGRHLPLHEDFSLGGVSDLRGYAVDQFRGDLRLSARAEYSVPLFKWRFLAFRALGFYDVGYIGYQARRLDDRVFLPDQLRGGYVRNDVGAGLRVYLNNIVLPLLGLDLGYGIEGHSPQIYFEVGLTDF